MPVIVAIDGPSGVGKSTTAKRVARALRIPHIDTGAMYRAVALLALRGGVALDDDANLERLASQSNIDFKLQNDTLRVLLDGQDVTEEIRKPEVSMASSTVSAVSAVRRVLVRKQQQLGRSTGGVLEGRDIGTKVFPETPHKFFLTARPEVRARRRQLQLQETGVDIPLEKVLEEMTQRDHQDSSRADSPLTFDATYHGIDTSDLSQDEVVDRIVATIQAASARAS